MTKVAKDKITLLLDSGAFSAWKRNSTVDLKEYTKFIEENEDRLFASVALDVIPGSPQAPKADPEGAAAASDYNLQYMLDRGVKPIPVFHQFENFKWLVKMIDDGHPYIGISPSDRQPTNLRMQWLDKVYTILCDSKGRPCVKTHGFGVTSTEILYTYPFYTADSTTWLILSGHGRMQLPAMHMRNGKAVFDFSKQVMLTVSPKSPRAKSPRQLILMGDQKKLAEQYLSEIGLTVDAIQNSYESRASMGIDVFERLVKHLHSKPVRFDRFTTWLPGAEPPAPRVSLKALPPFKMKLFYVAWANKAHSILRSEGITNRLLSYFHIRDWSEEEFDLFMQTGLIGGQYVPRKVKNGSRSTPRRPKEGSPSTGAGRPAAAAKPPVVRRQERVRL
jgi:hypothetical protein